MGVRLLVRRARTVFSRMAAPDAESSAETTAVDGTTTEENKRDPTFDTEFQRPEVPAEGLQHGVRDIEAITMTWSKRTLILVFINIWFLYFVNAFQSSVFASLSPYVSSSFTAHSLSGVPTALADAFSAAIYIPVGKMMDTWGRAEGFLLMTCFATMGLILLASCNSFAIYCTAYVFYYIGFSGMEYAIDVMTADASKLKNRGLAFAFTSSPYIITAFAGAKVADEFYYQVSWRWGLGCWAIIFPIVAAPLYFMLKANLRKAEREGHRIQKKSGRTFLQSVWHWIIEFDLPGVFMFTAGLVLFELPFDIASEAPNGWGSGYIIAMLVVGFSMLFFFAIYEKWVAPVPLLNIVFLTDRTVIGACLLDATYQLSYYCWNNYFTSFLQVVNGLTIAEAGYVSNTFDVVSGVLLLFVGWAIRKTGRFKWLLYISVPLYIFAQGLMIYFRKPGMGVGYQIMCQIFISIGGSIFIIVEQISILAAVDHQHVAAALALLNVVGTIGDSAGYTICTAIWTNTFPNALREYLPESAMSNFENIYEDLTVQTSYPLESEVRLAIQKAYAYAEVRMLSAGLGVMALAIAWTIMIRDIDLKKTSQVKGTVF
ncbi:Major facilitator superfamily domain general substrate transporter [Penicillium concentricum]|uniref:Major facilitator superfamily domain general substrate transporter n=1 Tax=Penicillium concentricum TaxID=293559 RepID=A0A9W9V7B1_9EURO|nr:Major facilitator superfamily domain general substrate transporter [Penicillium concentricum]KAJ5371588.1 Major facilitator superfamily domain general substrate transporter [Penicillium concentricum]